MRARTFYTRIIAYKKKDVYLGVAIDFDVMVQAASLEEALHELKKCIGSYLTTCEEEGESDEQIYRKASKKYQNMHDLFIELQKKKPQGTIENYLGTLSFSKKELADV